MGNPHNAMEGKMIDRMIRIQMEAYPAHWTPAEKRELARKHLGLKK